MSVATIQRLDDVLQATPEPVGQVPGALKVTEVIRNVVLVKAGFHSRKNFQEKFQHAPPQFVHQFRPRLKMFKKYRFVGAPI